VRFTTGLYAAIWAFPGLIVFHIQGGGVSSAKRGPYTAVSKGLWTGAACENLFFFSALLAAFAKVVVCFFCLSAI
jgi:hypothetical protein